MKIKKITMNAFGKFQDKTINLKPGLNLIQGYNEAGKTTTQAFIQGMYFGFYKPYRKKKTYAIEYEKYMPWEQLEYSGSLIYEVDGQEIRLERNFLRGKDSLTIYDNTTGEDITQDFKYDGVIRQHLPLGNLGITQGIYNSTVNIRQLPFEVESGSQEEIRQCYLERKNADGSEMNFNGIIRRLEEKKKTIGRSGQSKSKVGAAVRKRDELLIALREGEEAYKKVAQNQKTIASYQKRMKQIESDNEYMVKESVVNRKRELLQTYEKIAALERENNQIKAAVKDWEDLSRFNYKTLEGLKAIQIQIERLSDQMNYIEKEMDDLVHQIKNIRRKEGSKRGCLNGHAWETIARDYESFLEIKRVPEVMKEKSNLGISILIVSLIIFGIGLAGTMMNGTLPLGETAESILLTLGIAMTLVGVVSAIYVPATNNKKRRSQKLDIISEEQHSIFVKYGVATVEEFEHYYKKAFRIQKELEQMKNECELLLVQQSRHQAGFEVLFEQHRGITRDFANRLAEYGVKSIDIYAEGCRKAQQFDEMMARSDTNQRLLEGLYETVNAGKIVGGNTLWEQATPKAEEILNLGKEIARLEGENSTLMEGVSLPIETSEALKTLNAQIETCNLEIKGCDAALRILEQTQKKSHHESAPALNLKIGAILGEVTQHYQGVKIDDSMKVKVVDPDGGNFREAEQLSAGTMDQVHFAFRYGISDALDRDIPFILDEPFARYDAKRKAQALKLLAELSQRRQVILFTCGMDEGKTLRSLGQDFHTIDL